MNARDAGVVSTPKTNTTSAKNTISTITNAASNGIKSLAGASSGAAATANAISSSAQKAQGTFNQASVDQANALTQLNFERQMEYNSAEAQKQRKWQEKMASTAYQRTVKDMIKAGINPILASQLGATSVGGGSTASVGAPSGQAASEGNYTGQMENMSTQLALFGAIADAFGQALSGLGELKTNYNFNINTEKIVDDVIETTKSLAKYDYSDWSENNKAPTGERQREFLRRFFEN